jgi:hypothetical protein
MGYVPDWNRKSFCKAVKLADGGSPDLPQIADEPEPEKSRLQYGGGAGKDFLGRPNVGGFASYEVSDGVKVSLEGGGSGESSKSKQHGDQSHYSGGYRVGLSKDLGGDKEVGVGSSGYRYASKDGDQKSSGGKNFNAVDVRYRDGDTEVGAGYDMDSKRVQLNLRKRF